MILSSDLGYIIVEKGKNKISLWFYGFDQVT